MKRLFLALMIIVNIECYQQITTLQPVIDLVLAHKDKNILVLLDIDNTLLTTLTHLGSDQWFYYLVNYYQQQGLSHDQALNEALIYWLHVNNNINLIPTYQNVSNDINTIMHYATVLCLTARSEPIIERTLLQLLHNNIIIHKPMMDYNIVGFAHPAWYKDGTIFCGRNSKADILHYAMKTLNYAPDLLVFVDDKIEHLSIVETALTKKGIKGVLFNFVVESVSSFDSQQAEQQLIEFLKQYPLTTTKYNK